MIGLIQRVSTASVTLGGYCISEIKNGLLILLGIERTDTSANAEKLCDRIIHYRVFSDHNQKMNLDITQTKGSLLVVSQFTLTADTQKGRRPGFSNSAPPIIAEQLYNHFIDRCQQKGIVTKTGCFGADMKVALVNDGPVTFLLRL